MVEEILILDLKNLHINKALETSLNYKITLYSYLYLAQVLKYGELLTSNQNQAKASKNST